MTLEKELAEIEALFALAAVAENHILHLIAMVRDGHALREADNKEIERLRGYFRAENHGEICQYKVQLAIAVTTLQKIQRAVGTSTEAWHFCKEALAEIEKLK